MVCVAVCLALLAAWLSPDCVVAQRSTAPRLFYAWLSETSVSLSWSFDENWVSQLGVNVSTFELHSAPATSAERIIIGDGNFSIAGQHIHNITTGNCRSDSVGAYCGCWLEIHPIPVF